MRLLVLFTRKIYLFILIYLATLSVPRLKMNTEYWREKILKKKTRGPGYLSPYSDSLRAGRSGDWILVGARFSAPVKTVLRSTQPPVQRVPGFFPGGNVAGRVTDCK